RDVVRAQLTGKCLGEFVPHLPQRAVAVGLEEGDDAAWVPLQRTKRGAAFLRVVAAVIDHGDAGGAGAAGGEAVSWTGAGAQRGCRFSVRSVARHFSGLWPKSSITVMPEGLVPMMSKRRARPAKLPSTATASATDTPAAAAPAIAASALARLCRPGILSVSW